MPALKTISLHQQYDQEIAESSHCSQNEWIREEYDF